jgi:hypothetical protein
MVEEYKGSLDAKVQREGKREKADLVELLHGEAAYDGAVIAKHGYS